MRWNEVFACMFGCCVLAFLLVAGGISMVRSVRHDQELRLRANWLIRYKDMGKSHRWYATGDPRILGEGLWLEFMDAETGNRKRLAWDDRIVLEEL